MLLTHAVQMFLTAKDYTPRSAEWYATTLSAFAAWLEREHAVLTDLGQRAHRPAHVPVNPHAFQHTTALYAAVGRAHAHALTPHETYQPRDDRGVLALIWRARLRPAHVLALVGARQVTLPAASLD